MGTGSSVPRARSASGRIFASRMRFSTRSRAAVAASGKRSGRRLSGPAAAPRAGRLPPSKGASARDRNSQGRRAHALDIAAERRKRQIKLEISRLEKRRSSSIAARPAGLGAQGALLARLQQARDLHGQRRTTETTRTTRAICQPARASASGSTPAWPKNRRSS